VTFPVLFVHRSPRILYASARVRFLSITIWITRELRFEDRLLLFAWTFAPARGPFMMFELLAFVICLNRRES